jgi:hypothetical protein
MTACALIASMALAASWVDTSGRVQCTVAPDLAASHVPGAFTAGDERVVLLPFIAREEASTPAAVMRRLLCQTGLRAAEGSLQAASADLSASVSLLEAADGWAGAVALGPPGDAQVAARAQAASAACRIVPPRPPVVANGRVWDAAHRLSMAIPAGAEGFEHEGNGAARGSGWQVTLTASPPGTPNAEAFARKLSARAGTSSAFVTRSQVGALPAVLASGNVERDGRPLFIQAAVLKVGTALVGAVLVSDASAQIPAQQAFFAMLSSASAEGAP